MKKAYFRDAPEGGGGGVDIYIKQETNGSLVAMTLDGKQINGVRVINLKSSFDDVTEVTIGLLPIAPPAPKNRLVNDGDKSTSTCTWLNNEDYGFMSECGNSFHNDDNTIDWMKYCPYCGGKVIEQGKAD